MGVGREEVGAGAGQALGLHACQRRSASLRGLVLGSGFGWQLLCALFAVGQVGILA